MESLLCFFDESKKVYISTDKREYLLVKNFYIVFEAIIDELVGDSPLPDGMDKNRRMVRLLTTCLLLQALLIVKTSTIKKKQGRRIT